MVTLWYLRVVIKVSQIRLLSHTCHVRLSVPVQRRTLFAAASSRRKRAGLDCHICAELQSLGSLFMSMKHNLERESYVLTTYWFESTLSSCRLGGPAPRHGILNSLFQVALHLPSYARLAHLAAPL